jgi:hypothetical protein
MGRLGLACKILFNGDIAQKAMAAVSAAAQPTIEQQPPVQQKPAAEKKPARPERSEAVSLLAALQREARFVDFIQEPIDAFSDAQVGAAVREIHRGCGEVIQRMFAPSAIVEQEEGSSVEVSDPASGKFRLVGNVAQQQSGSITGQLAHHGWQTTKCEVPQWTGGQDGITVIAAAEIQVS